MNNHLAKTCVSLLLGLCASASALAGDMYALGSVGGLTYSGSGKTDLDTSLTASGATGLQSSMNTSSTGFKAMLGYQVNRNFAVEGGYVDLGSFKYSATVTGGFANADVTGSGLNISAMGIAPVNDTISLLGKVGYTLSNQKASVTGGGGSASFSENKNSLGFGVGGMYQLSPTLSLRAEWEKLFDDVNLISLGLQARF